MILPLIKNKNTYNRKIVAFGGLNLTKNFKEGELTDCTGISHGSFPSLTQRNASVTYFECNNPTAVILGKREFVATDDALYYDRKMVGKLSPGKKSMLQIGQKVVVFPDKVYYDISKGRFAPMAENCSLKGILVTFKGDTLTIPTDAYTEQSTNGEMILGKNEKVYCYNSVESGEKEFKLSGLSLKEAAELNEGDIFSEISGTSQYRIIKHISDEKDNTVAIINECVRIKNVSKGIFDGFKKGDLITISGCENYENNGELKITSKTANSITFEGVAFKGVTENADIVLKRRIPDFSCICSYENRLWGCVGNTIYASKLGDPLNFFIYENLSTDSFTVQSNTSGDFTAIESYGASCFVFKENICYKLYGNRPANFQLVESYGAGIQKGDGGSAVNAMGKLFYKGNGGIYCSYGSIPELISQNLGNIEMKNCTAGTLQLNYYISADTPNGREEFVYDIERGMWAKSGIKNVNGYFSTGETLYRLMPTGIEKMTQNTDNDAEWFVEFCPFDEKYHKTKNYMRLYVKLELFDNAWIRAEIKGDMQDWKCVMTRYGKEKEYINIPCTVKNCHEARLRLSGKGKCIIESIVREFSVN